MLLLLALDVNGSMQSSTEEMSLFRASALYATAAVLLAGPCLFGRPPEETTRTQLPPVARRSVDFARDIQPLFAARCHRCHGPNRQKNGLRLDRKADALEGGDSGAAIRPGKSAESLLILYVTGMNEDEIIMPPRGRRLTDEQVGLLRTWIDQGARWNEAARSEKARSEAAASDKTIDTREHWAFRPVARPPVPQLKDAAWVRNPIDAFVLSRLESSGMKPAHEADRPTLIRRLYLDLLGLTPAPDEVDAFVSDTRPDAYERLVDRLLASPHFGERWGRHWLDLARYADSNGYEDDKYRPDAWRYRDWVIEAINKDVPFDQFTIEQLAGDLLPGATYEQKAATGFHRMLPSNEVGVKAGAEEFRVKTAKDRTDTTGMVWLGLTVGCAKCHSHKYDPISQREYYGLYAFFNSVLEVDIDAPPLPEKYQLAYKKAQEAYARTNPENNNNAPLPPSAKALTLAEEPQPRPTYIHLRGDFQRNGRQVHSRVPAFLPPLEPRSPKADRLDLARWIVDPENPLTRRVAVNRLWKHLFGHGLVRTPEDFGLSGEPPSHPDLLDWLAAEFLYRGWKRKAMIKLMVRSATYRQASRARPELTRRDPENALLARQNRFQVEAEIVRDLALSACGLLRRAFGGPSIQPPLPAALADMKELRNERFMETTEGADRYRRGVYVNVQRTFPYPALQTFDAADPNVSCARRDRSNTPMQALTLLNEPAFFECAQALGLHLLERNGEWPERLCYAFQRCLARRPDVQELATLEQLLREHVEFYRAHPDAAGELLADAAPLDEQQRAEAAGWVGVARTLMNLEEFVTRE